MADAIPLWYLAVISHSRRLTALIELLLLPSKCMLVLSMAHCSMYSILRGQAPPKAAAAKILR